MTRRVLSPLRIGRRKALSIGLGGAALLAVGGGVASWVSSGYGALLAPGDVAIALSVKELAVVRALVDALFPEEDGFPSGVSLGVHQRVDEELWAAPDALRDQLKNGIQLLEHAPPLYGEAHRFTALGRHKRAEVFAAVLRSRRATLRQIGIALKQLTHLYYYTSPIVWPHIHYDGTFVETPKPPDSHLSYEQLLKSRRSA